MIRIGITMGDPGGIGPEVLLKALLDPELCRQIQPLVFGDKGILGELTKRFGGPKDLSVFQGDVPQGLIYSPGRFSEISGQASMAYLKAACQQLKMGELDALVTGPIHKRALQEAKRSLPGQTEWLADYFDTQRAVMFLSGPRLKVVLATTHLPLEQVARSLTVQKLVNTVETAHLELTRYFFPNGPRLAVAALNPHGEVNGRPGPEEQEVIIPAVEKLQAKDIDIVGPISGDVIFAQALAGKYDVVVALYHDQGLAPIKCLHFAEAVNVTLGIGVIRSSPDHGVGYDIAGTGIADPTSMKAAIRLAGSMVEKAGSNGVH